MKTAATILLMVTVAVSAAPGWSLFHVLHNPGNDTVLAAGRGQGGSGWHLVTMNENNLDWTWSLITVSPGGTVFEQTALLESRGQLAYWVEPCFLEDGRLAVAHGNRITQDEAKLILMTPDVPENGVEYELSGSFPLYENIVVNTLVPATFGNMFLAATGTDASGERTLFTAVIGADGEVAWQVPVYGYEDMVINSATAAALSDGTYSLSFREDRFPSGVTIWKVSPEEGVLWSVFIPLDCEFKASVTGFHELGDGSILCSGGFDELGLMEHRGFSAILDAGGNILETKHHDYAAHTWFVAVDGVPQERTVLTGWSGDSGEFPLEVIEEDAVFAILSERGEWMEAVRLNRAGSQRPVAVIGFHSGLLAVAGEHRERDAGETNVFVGAVRIPR